MTDHKRKLGSPHLEPHAPPPDLAGEDIGVEPGYFGRNHRYIPPKELLEAAHTALVVGAPLLLVGEPGCGKSEFAWVVARSLHAQAPEHHPDATPLRCHVRSDTRGRDLLYRYDAIGRFGDMQHGGTNGHRRARDIRNYLDLMPLGQALLSEKRRVLLIDEIDKAPRDLPNDLLWELDQSDLEVQELPEDEVLEAEEAQDGEDSAPPALKPRMWHPRGNKVPVPIRRRIEHPKDWAKPFILVTSNGERQLPDAFLRRCVFYQIPRPSTEALQEILKARFGSKLDDSNRDILLKWPPFIYDALRKNERVIKKPALAELLMWVRALVGDEDDGQKAQASRIRILPGIGGTLARGAIPSWKDLPGLECLIKHEDDLKELGVHP